MQYLLVGIKAVWDRRNEFQITESVQYYFNRIDNIKLPGYVPDKVRHSDNEGNRNFKKFCV